MNCEPTSFLLLAELEGELVNATDAVLTSFHIKFTDAVARRDAGAIAALYSTDGLILPPDGRSIRGGSAIGAFWLAAVEHGFSKAEFSRFEVLRSTPDLIVETGLAASYSNADGEESTEHNNYVVVHTRTAAGWTVACDIWADLPSGVAVGGSSAVEVAREGR